MEYLHPNQRIGLPKPRKLQRMVTSLTKLKKNLGSDESDLKLIEASIKQLSGQGWELTLPKPLTLTKKKKFPSHKLPKNDHNKSLEEAKKIFDEDTPQRKNFITAELFQKKSFYKMLKGKKRNFGFNGEVLKLPEFNVRDCNMLIKNPTSRNVTRRLNAILYNNLYRNSQRSKRSHLVQGIERGVITSQMGYALSERTSPVPLQAFQQKIEKMKEDKHLVAKEFHNVIKEASLEIELLRLKLGMKTLINTS